MVCTTLVSVNTVAYGNFMGPRKRDPLSRQAWVRGAVELMAEGGVENVRVEVLARRLGKTKGSFYWHFKDRPALLEAVVATWEAAGTQALIDAVNGLEGTPTDKLRLLWRLATTDGLGAELALREWARKDVAIATRVKAVDAKRLAFLHGLYAELGLDEARRQQRALQLYALLIGTYFIQDVADAVIDATVEALTSP